MSTTTQLLWPLWILSSCSSVPICLAHALVCVCTSSYSYFWLSFSRSRHSHSQPQSLLRLKRINSNSVLFYRWQLNACLLHVCSKPAHHHPFSYFQYCFCNSCCWSCNKTSQMRFIWFSVVLIFSTPTAVTCQLPNVILIYQNKS